MSTLDEVVTIDGTARRSVASTIPVAHLAAISGLTGHPASTLPASNARASIATTFTVTSGVSTSPIFTSRKMPPLPRPHVTPAGRAALTSLLKREVGSRTIPATFMGAANADGEIFWACAGEKEYGSPEQVTDKTVLQIYSMTKLITSVSTSICVG